MRNENIKNLNRNRKCPIEDCDGIAVMTIFSKSQGTSWRCQKCGHGFSEIQRNLGDF